MAATRVLLFITAQWETLKRENFANSVSCLSVHEHYLRKLLWTQGEFYQIALLVKKVHNFNAINAEEKNK